MLSRYSKKPTDNPKGIDLKKGIDLFVTCGQGLEPLLKEELESLGFQHLRPGFRGVYVEGLFPSDDLTPIYRINYCSRIAGRVLLPIKFFRCYNRDTLYQSASEINWSPYIPKGKTFAIDANVTHRNFKNSLFAAQVVKDAICDQFRDKFGSRPDVEVRNPDVQLNLFIHNEKGVLSFDTSGAPLYKRGYRQEGVEAPLQESLAAAILRLANYSEKSEEVLFDPCCGSGTLLIEAALIASNTAPGYLRKQWGFMTHPKFSQQDWLKVKNQVDALRRTLKKGHFFGADKNRDSVNACKANLLAAGFQQDIQIFHANIDTFTPPILPQLVITNPPHGRRLDEVDNLRPLYRIMGNFMKNKTVKPARGFIFTGSLELTKEVGLAAKKKHIINNSGIDSRLLEFDLF